MPTLTIDGREITVERGTTILEAAKQLGIDIPTFCYHPGLSAPANCRMCLVESNKSPKPLPACYAQVMDGMEVDTKGAEVVKTRKAVLEFILLNHPVDCPICDQAGECVLQDHYFRYSAQPSRLTMRKVHKPKVKPLGPDIVLDAERCILCTRCIRFCDEVAKQSQLEIVNRGEHSEITTFPGEQLDNPYAGNVVDICPVGALTSLDFRFRTRVWLLQSANGVCPECSRGCTVRVDTYENVARRYKPLHNPKVNGWWMCDKGRLSYRRWFEGRVEGPLAPVDGKRRVVTGAEALDAAAEALQGVDRARLAVVLSPWLTNEDAFLLARLAGGALAGAQVFVGGRAAGEGDDILIQPDKNPNTRGLTAILEALGVAWQPLARLDAAKVSGALVVGDEHDLAEGQVATLAATGRLVLMGSFMGELWKAATVFLPARIPMEKLGTFTNFEGVVQVIEPAVRPAGTCKSEGWYALKLAAALGDALAYRTPLEVFQGLTAEVAPFAGMTYENLRPHGLKLGEGPAPQARPEAPPMPATPPAEA